MVIKVTAMGTDIVGRVQFPQHIDQPIRVPTIPKAGAKLPIVEKCSARNGA